MAHGNVTIPIPIELRSGTVGGVLVSADAVYDYNLGKTQEEINQSSGADIADDLADLRDDLDALQQQVNQIIGDQTTVNLTVSPTVIFVGQSYNISLTATCNPEANSIVVKKAGTTLGSGSGTRYTFTDSSVTASASGNIAYSADFAFDEVTKSASKNVTAVNKIYYGIGTDSSYAGYSEYQTARTSAAGSYQFTPTDAKRYIYILQPYAMTAINLSNVKLSSGFGYNLTLITDNAQIDGARYRVYRSAAENAAEQFTITIS